MPNTRPRNTKSSAGKPAVRRRSGSSIVKLRIAVGVVAIIMVISVVFAFVWPGWAVRRADTPSELPSASVSASPTISASALPGDASALLSAMPDSVANFVRTSTKTVDTWRSSDPLEEYELVYSTGDKAQDVTVTVAQWSESSEAQKQYDSVVADESGDQLAEGNVKVDGKATGSYVVKEDGSNAVAIWRNDTVVFEATGPKASVETIYQQFPL